METEILMIPFEVYFATIFCGTVFFIGLFAGILAWALGG